MQEQDLQRRVAGASVGQTLVRGTLGKMPAHPNDYRVDTTKLPQGGLLLKKTGWRKLRDDGNLRPGSKLMVAMEDSAVAMEVDALFAVADAQAAEEARAAEALEAARKLTNDHDIWVRSTAVEILGDEGGSEVLEEIRGYLKSYDVPMKLAASAGLVKLGKKNYLEGVLDPLTHPIPDRRYQAIGHLGKIGSKEVLPHLVKLLDHSEPGLGN